MPKWGIHNIVMAEAMGQLLTSSNPSSQAAATDLYNNQGNTMMGAVGPDLFFFAPDYEVVDKLYKLYQNIEKVVDLYNDIVQPFRDIKDAVVEPVEDAVETLAPSTVALIRHAVEEIRETASLFQSAVGTGLFSGVVSGFNIITDTAGLPSVSAALFQEFTPPLQFNKPEQDWYWFDMLHYRKTGEFASNLVNIANSGNAEQRAYAYGYLSHIATDLVGHAYVNQIVGGPYRLHGQRHTVVENFMDCWKFKTYYDVSVNQVLFDNLGMPDSLPTSIGDMLDQAFRNTYSATDHPQILPGDGFLTRNQINDTYDIFYGVLKILKKMAVKRPEEPFSGVADVLSEALSDILEPPPSPPSSSGGACSFEDIFSFGLTSSSRDCYQNFFENLEDWLEYFGELFAWAFETLLDIIDMLLAALLSLPIMVLLAILYGIQLLMYELYQSARFLLALEGFVTPEPQDLESSHGRNLTTTFQCGISPFKYPKKTNLGVSHLVCATSPLEQPTTAADFYSSSPSVTPDDFIRNRPFDLRALTSYANSESPEQTRSIERDQLKIGNAIDLTEFMIAVAANPAANKNHVKIAFTNWNLDSDRGYGYKAWEGIVPSEQENEVREEEFTNE